MRALLHILVLLLAITSLVAPATAPCAMPSANGHACCARQIQVDSPSCCKPGTATPGIAERYENGIASMSTASGSLLPLRTEAPATVPIPAADRSGDIPLLKPATILRT